jgi:LPS export ABC transporter protein LptC
VVPRSLRLIIPSLVWLLVSACGDGNEIELPSDGAGYPEQETEAYHTQQTRVGIPVWELWGDRAESYKGEDIMVLHGVRMNFYQEGESAAVLTAETAEVDQKTEFTTARGNVVVINKDGDRLESEVLHWDPSQQLIQTDEFVKFTRGDQILTGYGMDTDPHLANVEIHRQFEGDLPANEASDEGEGR